MEHQSDHMTDDDPLSGFCVEVLVVSESDSDDEPEPVTRGPECPEPESLPEPRPVAEPEYSQLYDATEPEADPEPVPGMECFEYSEYSQLLAMGPQLDPCPVTGFIGPVNKPELEQDDLSDCLSPATGFIGPANKPELEQDDLSDCLSPSLHSYRIGQDDDNSETSDSPEEPNDSDVAAIVADTCSQLLIKLESVRLSVLQLQYSLRTGTATTGNGSTIAAYNRTQCLWDWKHAGVFFSAPLDEDLTKAASNASTDELDDKAGDLHERPRTGADAAES